MRTITHVALSAAVAGAAIGLTAGTAAAQTAWYAGGGVSTVGVDTAGNGDLDLAMVQGRAGLQALGFLALEGEVGFGVTDDDLNIVTIAPGQTDARIETEIGAFAVARLPLSAVNLFARAGYAHFEFDNPSLGPSLDDSGSGPAYGVGADIQILSLRGRLDYTRYEFDDGDADGWGVSLLWEF